MAAINTNGPFKRCNEMTVNRSARHQRQGSPATSSRLAEIERFHSNFRPAHFHLTQFINDYQIGRLLRSTLYPPRPVLCSPWIRLDLASNFSRSFPFSLILVVVVLLFFILSLSFSNPRINPRILTPSLTLFFPFFFFLLSLLQLASLLQSTDFLSSTNGTLRTTMQP